MYYLQYGHLCNNVIIRYLLLTFNSRCADVGGLQILRNWAVRGPARRSHWIINRNVRRLPAVPIQNRQKAVHGIPRVQPEL